MARNRHALNPAKVKADLDALETDPPPELFQRRLDLRRRLTVVLLDLLTVALLTISFAPFGAWYLAYVALIPWCMSLSPTGHMRRWTVGWAWGAGSVFYLLNLYWLTWITLVGYVALVFYLSLYWLLAALILRAAMRRDWPMWIVLPVIWTALEYARAYVISGFPWFFLAHSQYDNTLLIQVADLTGQYGVSFFVALVNGAVLDLLTAPLFLRGRARGPRMRQGILVGPAVAAVTLAAMLGYGAWRVGQSATEPGPIVGIVQHAVPISLTGRAATPEKVFLSHVESTERFIGSDVELVIWPETMLPAGLNPWVVDREPETMNEHVRELRAHAERVGELSRRLQAPILAGGTTFYENPAPEADRPLMRNSALLFDRSWRASDIYSKVHLVPFSESVPFKYSVPWLHRLLRSFVPESMPQLEPGSVSAPMDVPAGRRSWTVATPICYEGVFARVCRALVVRDGEKSADIIANLSNDGWFVWRWGQDDPYRGSTEQAQHLAQYCFRAVENRTPVVRAVNTGISASIDSNGRIAAQVSQYGARTMVAGTLLLDGAAGEPGDSVAHGPRVLVDGRVSVYSLIGDAFAMLVAASAVAVAGVLAWKRRRDRRMESDEQEREPS